MVLSPIYVSHKLKKKKLESVLISKLIKLNLIFLTFIIKEWKSMNERLKKKIIQYIWWKSIFEKILILLNYTFLKSTLAE